MNSSYSNPILKYSILLADLLILNSLLTLCYSLGGILLPPLFTHHPFLFYFAANSCMVIAAFIVPEIVSVRLVKFHKVVRRVLEYVALFSFLFFFTIRLASDGGGIFDFMVCFVPSLYLLLILSRAGELLALRQYRDKSNNHRKVLFVGNDHSLLRLYRNLGGSVTRDYIIMGYYADAPMPNAPSNLKLLGNIDDLNYKIDHAEAGRRPCDDMFVSISHTEGKEVERIAACCDEHSIHFYYVPREFPNTKLNLTPETFGQMQVLTNHREPLMDPRNSFVKRAFDVCLSLVVCIFLLILTPIIGLIIKLSSPGPIFFKQKRTGINGKTFCCYKFRSMDVNKQADTLQATEHDPRKFAFGNFMRKTNIDELPQFFNVLIGDMSIVGPRPHMLAHTEEYSKLIKTYMVRHFCRPGITGLAQIKGFRGETKELWQMEGRVRYDIEYIENWSFWLDMKIIAYTAWSVIHPDSHAY